MSIYTPPPSTLRIEHKSDGWYVMDKFGPCYGPVTSVMEATDIIHAAHEAWSGASAWFPRKDK